MRCELTVRAYDHLKEMIKIDFQGVCINSRIEGFALSLVRDSKILHNLMNDKLGKLELFYLFSSLQTLSFTMFG
jgi:hypothetical protein